MRVVIIEDERPAAQRLIRLLEEIDSKIEVVEIIESVESATNWFLHNALPDLIFMDVQLEDGLCFEIFENIDLNVPVIFTTAFDEYSLKAFKVNSIDYLLEELKKAIDKFSLIRQRGFESIKIESLLNQLQPKSKLRFLVKIGEHFRSIQVSNINYFFIKERCSFINVDKGKNYTIDYSLDKIEKMINPAIFFRISRNYIINFNAICDIVAYSSSRLKIYLNNMSDDEEILVSRERVSEFKKWMDR